MGMCPLLGAGRTTCMGMVPCTLDWMLVMALLWMPFFLHAATALPRRNPSLWLLTACIYPSTASESHKDEVILPSSTSPGGIFLLPLPIFLLWNILASLSAGVNIPYLGSGENIL